MHYKIRKKAFTLIELMVIISIISLLSSIVLGSLKEAKLTALRQKNVIRMKEVEKAIGLGMGSETFPKTNNFASSASWLGIDFKDMYLVDGDNPFHEIVLNSMNELPSSEAPGATFKRNYLYYYEDPSLYSCGKDSESGVPMLLYRIYPGDLMPKKVLGRYLGPQGSQFWVNSSFNLLSEECIQYNDACYTDANATGCSDPILTCSTNGGWAYFGCLELK